MLLFLVSALPAVFSDDSASSNYSLQASKVVVTAGDAASQRYVLDDVNIGDIAGGKAGSANYSFDSNTPYNEDLAPCVPSVELVTAITNESLQTICGGKDTYTSIYVNGYIAVPLDEITSWSNELTLEEGDNLFSITSRNAYQVESDAVNVSIFLDSTAPLTPEVSDDGISTSILTELHASWSSYDPETDIVEYQYAIGTGEYKTDIVQWTSSREANHVVHRGLSLNEHNIYYVSVRSRNQAGSWSDVGTSDGIVVNLKPPLIVAVEPPDLKEGYVNDVITLCVNAVDRDGGELMYQFCLDNTVIESWSNDSVCRLSTDGSRPGLHNIKIKVRDELYGEAEKEFSVYLYRKPINPPAI